MPNANAPSTTKFIHPPISTVIFLSPVDVRDSGGGVVGIPAAHLQRANVQPPAIDEA